MLHVCIPEFTYVSSRQERVGDVVCPHAQGGSECLKLIVYRLKDSQGVGGTNTFNTVYRESSNFHLNTRVWHELNQGRVSQFRPRLSFRRDIQKQV